MKFLQELTEAKYSGKGVAFDSAKGAELDKFILTYFDVEKPEEEPETDMFPASVRIKFKVKPEFIVRLNTRSNKIQEVVDGYIYYKKGSDPEISLFKRTGGRVNRKLSQPPERLFVVYQKMFP